MKKVGIILIILSTVMGLISCMNQGDASERYSADQLQKDFGQFRKILEDKTAGLYTDRIALSVALDQAEAEMQDGMTEQEFFRILAPVVTQLRCGHSFLSVSKATEEDMRSRALFFPLDVRFIDDRLFVIADPYGSGATPGTEILSINGRMSSELMRTISSNLTTDGRDRGRPRYDAERWFASMYFRYIDNPESFVLEVLTPGSSSASDLQVLGVRDSSLSKISMGVIFDTADTPLSSLFMKDYALLKIPVFMYSDQNAYKESVASFFSELTTRQTDTLILDLRGNYGGSPAQTVELFKYLINESLPFFAEDNPFYLNKWKKPVEPALEAFSGRLYILMDEACFSMNSFLLSLLQYHGIGTFVGARSSGGFMCSDSSRNAVLSNTGLRLRYSTDIFKTAVEGQEEGIGIEPDMYIEWTIEDYIEGNDPVLSAALTNAGL